MDTISGEPSLDHAEDERDMLPTFFVLGAAKAGTTTLHDVLSRHPEIFMSRRKEPHFFDNDKAYARGLTDYAATHFGRMAAEMRVRGEATPSYLHLAGKVAPRIAAAYVATPPRFVIVLRDPVARAYSHYRDRLRAGTESESFETALRLEPDRLKATPDAWVGYYRDGLYSEQIETYFRQFPRDRFLILRHEQLSDDRDGVARTVFAFLGVDPGVLMTAGEARNAAAVPRSRWLRDALVRPAAWKTMLKWLVPSGLRRDLKRAALRRNLRVTANPPPPADVANRLRERYRSELDRLETLLDWDLATWRAPRSPNSSK